MGPSGRNEMLPKRTNTAKQIYAFFYWEAEAKRYFYVGRSKDLERRMREHRYCKATGHEDKYALIRHLENSLRASYQFAGGMMTSR